MTPYQQLSLCSPEEIAETIYFGTMEEYMEWASKRNK